MGEYRYDFWNTFFSFRWFNRKDRARRGRKAYTTRANKHTQAYRARRKARNKCALAQRKVNRARA
jgi:hypothetical protein